MPQREKKTKITQRPLSLSLQNAGYRTNVGKSKFEIFSSTKMNQNLKKTGKINTLTFWLLVPL